MLIKERKYNQRHTQYNRDQRHPLLVTAGAYSWRNREVSSLKVKY